MSCGERTVKYAPFPVNLPYNTYSFEDEQKYMIYYSLFFFMWFTAFLIAATEYVLIVAVAQWYFTQNSDKWGNFSICTGYWWALSYNMGSLLFGSFIIAVVWTIRLIFEYIERKIRQSAASG